MKSIFEELNSINDSLSLMEGGFNALSCNLDRDILNQVDTCDYSSPDNNNDTKCSRSAVRNALYYVSKGKDVEFCLGSMNPSIKCISHCWIVVDGEVIQTHMPLDPNMMNKVILNKQYSVTLKSDDIEAAKDSIKELVRSI